MFKRAERKKAKLRLAMLGPSGSGKTYSALQIAKGIGGSIAFIDTENGSGELYAHLCEYDICQIMPPFTPEKYVQAIKAAEKARYDVIIVDSLSHAWSGSGGLLEQVDQRKGAGNQFSAWRDITPMHNQFVDAMVQSSAHIIATMRTKTGYEMEKNDRGKVVPVKVGLQPVQRDGLEYEFTVVFDLDLEKHIARASKDRTSIFDGLYFTPTPETGEQLRDWLESGIDPDEAMVKEATELIDGCSTVTKLKSIWNEHGAKWQSRPAAFAKISAIVATKNKELAPANPESPFNDETEQQSPQRDEYEPGGGGMGDPVPSDEAGQYQQSQPNQPAEPEPLSDNQRKAIMGYFNKCGMPYTSHKQDVLSNLSNFFQLEQPLTSIKELTKDMASSFIDAINSAEEAA